MEPDYCTFRVERPVFEQDQLNKAYDYSKPHKSLLSSIGSKCGSCNPGRCICNAVPAFRWLCSYEWRRDVIGDMVSGATVAVMHIPQGLAYALLGNVPPIVGIYTAFFPVLAYFFLGTSRHISMGTFAVVCLMTGKTVVTYSKSHAIDNGMLNPPNGNNFTDMNMMTDQEYTPTEVATAVTFMVAIYQLIMWVCRAGILCTLLSETLVNGFTTGAAIHVLVSQLKDLLGMETARHKGPFKLIYTVIDLITNIQSANLAAVVVSVVTLTILSINNEVIKPWFSKKCKYPIPIELVAVVVGTLVSSWAHLSQSYAISTVGHIPTGLPTPSFPPFSLLSAVALDSFTITMVAYSISMSMALMFAQKLSYDVDSNQELLAQGVGNLVGSCFSCIPFTASLSRSLIQQSVGGKTQLASIFSCSILLVVLLWIGPFFETLPRCVLASIIVVALKGMFMQVTHFIRFWRSSYLDGIVWIGTFATAVFVDIDFGLLAGITLSLVSIFVQGMKPYICLMGMIPGTEFYLDINRYKGTNEIAGIKIFHYCGGLNFASRTHFISEVYRLVDVCPKRVLSKREKSSKKNKDTRSDLDQHKLQDGITNLTFIDDYGTSASYQNTFVPVPLKYLIVDFSALSYIDPSGVNALRILGEDFQKIDVPLFIAGISGPVYETLSKCGLLDDVPCPIKIFPTIHDAVIFARTKVNEDRLIVQM